jgi:hypothetical protein
MSHELSSRTLNRERTQLLTEADRIETFIISAGTTKFLKTVTFTTSGFDKNDVTLDWAAGKANAYLFDTQSHADAIKEQIEACYALTLKVISYKPSVIGFIEV